MTEPVIFDRQPAVLDLEPGTYFWCSCGQSENQPFCDGKHKGTGLAPVKFVVEAAKKAALCNCKYSKNQPFCDGSHSSLA